MGPEKNALTVIDALALLRKRGLPLPHITWVGAADPSGTGRAYAAAVDARIHALGLEAQWTRLPRRDDIPALLAQHDAGLLASIYEGTPNFVCEALASGRPVIGSAVGDIPVLLEGNGVGMLFPPLDSAALADAMAKFQSLGAADYAKMSRAARNFVESSLSAEQYVTRWEELICRMISASQSKFQQRP
jgi:glycosyltransferase involved in cell wall biosynthesis